MNLPQSVLPDTHFTVGVPDAARPQSPCGGSNMNIQANEAPEPVITADALRSLRRRALDSHRAKVALPPDMINEMKPEDVQLLFHELRVHQVELEAQNDELLRVQAALELARERYFDLYDMAPVGYCTVNQAGLVLEANLMAATLLGVSRSVLVTQLITHFMPRAQRLIYQSCCDLMRASGATQGCELQLQRDDGSCIWVSLVVNLAKVASGDDTLRVMLKDISERIKLDAVLQQRNIELERLRHVADKANGAKSEFLTSMSHELRSPLNAILGFAQLMDAAKPAPTLAQKASIDQILHSGWHLLELVNEILDLASIESGQLALVMAREPLADVLQDCQTMIEPQAQASEVVVSFVPCEQLCWVHADRRRLKQVVINLLSNAIKYNHRHGTVQVKWTLTSTQRVRVSVKDSGVGLTAAQLGQLFQPFNRLGQEAGPQQGTGIGLVVSKRLVELMGGRIGAYSTPGIGSVFWFELLQTPATP